MRGKMPTRRQADPKPDLTAIIGKTANSASYLAEFLPEIREKLP
jgi:hypothetical protein